MMKNPRNLKEPRIESGDNRKAVGSGDLIRSDGELCMLQDSKYRRI
jgi:hypothetical protein